MAVLSDRTIRDLVSDDTHLVEPFDVKFLQPSSYDFHLGNKLLLFRDPRPGEILDPVLGIPKDLYIEQEFGSYVLQPHELVMVATQETFAVLDGLCAKVEGKSSLARIGLQVLITAGYIDPGFGAHVSFEATGRHGNRITLEVKNENPKWPVRMTAGMRIGQIQFTWMDEVPERPYGHPELGSHYTDSAHVRGAGHSLEGLKP